MNLKLIAAAYPVEITLIGLCILAVISFNYKRQTGVRACSQTVFLAVLRTVGSLILLEFMLSAVKLLHMPFHRTATAVLAFVFYLLNPLPEALWVAYLDTIIHKEKPPRPQFWAAVFLPFAANAVFSLISLFRPFTFTVLPDGSFARGPFYFLMVLSCYGYFLFYFFIAAFSRNHISRSEYISLLFAALLPVIGGLIQSVFYGVSVVWVSFALALLIVYINMQSVQIYTDPLTGLANRRKFDEELNRLFSARHPEESRFIAGMMIDVDNFKAINDHYGHGCGDHALELVGDTLRRSIRRGDLAARIGGDEFALLMAVSSPEAAARVESRIRENIDLWNARREFPYEIHLSIGCDIIDRNARLSAKTLLKRIDQRMYSDKRSHKSGSSNP